MRGAVTADTRAGQTPTWMLAPPTGPPVLMVSSAPATVRSRLCRSASTERTDFPSSCSLTPPHNNLSISDFQLLKARGEPGSVLRIDRRRGKWGPPKGLTEFVLWTGSIGMPRPLRIQYSGALYHVLSRGDHREAIFCDDRDRVDFLCTLGRACEKTGWQVHAYCLMTNHFHLVVETPRANLVEGMKWLLGTYTLRFNRRHQHWAIFSAAATRHS